MASVKEGRDEPSSSELPSFGQKHFEPNGSYEQQQQIHNSVSHIEQIISHKPVKLLESLSKAVWCPEVQLAEVTHKTGSHWVYMGHQINQKLYIYPEEALFLLETGCLELLYNNLPLSIQRAYFLLFSSQNNITVEKYRAYSHLSNLGYKVVRHSPQNTLTKYEKDLEVHKLNIKLKKCGSNPQAEKRCQSFEDSEEGKKKLKMEKIFPIECDENSDVKEVLKKAQIFQVCADNDDTPLNFDFDVYTESFKKSCLQLPDYRVVVHRGDDSVPDLKDIRCLRNKYKDGVPVIQAVVFSDHIAFCEINSANIPDVLE